MPEADPAAVALRLVIHGLVQGVSYRASTADTARRLALHGWVRNRLGGSVEAVVYGPKAAVDLFVEWAWEGPPQARVTHIHTQLCEEPAAGFEVLPTR